MAVALDAVATDIANSGTVTFPITCTGSNISLYIFSGQRYGGTTGLQTVAYNGSPATLLRYYDDSNVTGNFVHRLLIGTGDGLSHNVVVSSLSSRRFGVTAVSLTGVDQTTPEGTIVGSRGHDSAPTDTVASATNDMVLDLVTWNVDAGQTVTVGSGQTQRSNLFQTPDLGAAVSTQAGAASVVMDWAASADIYWNHVAVPVKAGGAAPGGSPLSAVLQMLMAGDGN